MTGIMHTIDFFDPKYIPCQEVERSNLCFGICDSKTGAYTTLSEPYDCIVANPSQKEIQFVPIDHTILILDKNGNKLSSCDGMMYNKNDKHEFIIFIELKSGLSIRNWRSDAIKQLLSTVQVFIHKHDPQAFQTKKCYASNAVHQITGKVYQNELEDFAEKTGGFMLHINYKVEL